MHRPELTRSGAVLSPEVQTYLGLATCRLMQAGITAVTNYTKERAEYIASAHDEQFFSWNHRRTVSFIQAELPLAIYTSGSEQCRMYDLVKVNERGQVFENYIEGLFSTKGSEVEVSSSVRDLITPQLIKTVFEVESMQRELGWEPIKDTRYFPSYI